MDDERDAADQDLERDPVFLHVPLDPRFAGEVVEHRWVGDRDGDLGPRVDPPEGSVEDARAWGTMLADTAGTVGAFMETALDSIPWRVGEPEPDPLGERSPVDMKIKVRPEEVDFRTGPHGESSDSGRLDVIET